MLSPSYVPVALRFVDVGVAQRLHAVAHHGAAVGVQHRQRQALLLVLGGGDAVAAVLGEEVRPVLQAVGVERVGVAGVELLQGGSQPALAETLKGFESVAWFGIVGPPKTPAAVADKVAAAVAEALREPDVLKRPGEMSAEPMGLSPADTAAFMRQETERWSAVIRAADIKLD